MGWFSDLLLGPDLTQAVPAQALAPESDDSLEGLRRSTYTVTEDTNAASGVLPPAGVALARLITDSVHATLDLEGDLPVQARITLHKVITDYLPTTMNTYTAATRHQQSPEDMAKADTALREQMEFILGALRRTRAALREHDERALEAQGHFLRTKYTESDL